jgi:putative flippase GtrA
MAQLMNAIETHGALRSAARFVIVGMLGTSIDFALFSALNLLLGVPALVANTLSYGAGIANNYVLHRNWTFDLRPRRAMRGQLVQFIGISLSALIANNLLVLWLTPVMNGLFIDPTHGAIAAKIGATAMVMGWNFFANHFWTFRTAGKAFQA